MVFLPEAPQGGKVYSDRVVLNWLPADGATGYIVIFKTLFEEELVRFESDSTSLDVELDQKELAGNNELMVKVLSKSDPASHSAQFAIRRMTGKEKEAIKKEMEAVSPTLEESTALNKFILAGFFEEKLLIIDAITAYQDAVRLEPEITAYQQAYTDFLNRLGFELKK
jgi:hypothetical protein